MQYNNVKEFQWLFMERSYRRAKTLDLIFAPCLAVLSEEQLPNTSKRKKNEREKREEVGVARDTIFYGRSKQNSAFESFQAVPTLPSGKRRLNER
jgi:hypothetical protein